MKLSVILGVMHMLLGIVLKAVNSLQFRQIDEFWFEFVPQLVFMLCTFAYMDILLVAKWLTNWDGRTSQAPSIINVMIQMPLRPMDPISPALWGDGSSQLQLQHALLGNIANSL